ncbi:MAG: hypothetical protein WAL75_17575 [Terracidiphilus sp.]
MSKMIGLVFTATFLLLGPSELQRTMFSKYKTVEAYEVRPGILMMPTFSRDGQLCEIGLERLHYTPDKITLSSDLSRQEVYRIIDELAPLNERGSKATSPLEQGVVDRQGNALVTSEEYENVSIRIYSEATAASTQREITASDVVATITWKHRNCQ